MNADFHYYATYLAARLADYESKDAQKIAYAAAFVDYFDYATYKKYMLTRKDLIFTSQDIYELILFALKREPSADVYYRYWPNYVFDIWSSFHFLPGNEDMKIKFTGKTEHSEQFGTDSWSIDDRCRETFKLLCTTNSDLAIRMINDIKNTSDKAADLHLVGLRMHVLADTWAHQLFSATGQWFMNDADATVYEFPEGENSDKIVGWTSIKNIQDWWKKLPNIDDTDESFSKNQFFAVPAIAPFYDHIAELGHGRMGHLPDYSSMTYSYKPSWSEDYITRDGTEVFTNALAQMTEALCCIRNGKVFQPESYYDLNKILCNEDKKKKFNRMLQTKKVDLSDGWRIAIRDLFGFKEDIPRFQPEKWFYDYVLTWNREKTDLIYFNTAAKRHMDFVIGDLKAKNIYPYLSTTYKHACYLKTGNTPSLYICQTEINDGRIYADFMPKLGNRQKAPLMIVKQNKTPLKSGDVVEITTVETTKSGYGHHVSDKPYLTAFKTGYRIMYATQGYRTNAQKWKIYVPGKEDGTIIENGTEFTIQNIFYKEAPYLNSFNKGGKELLTLTEQPRTWIFEHLPSEVLELF